jgi:sulfur-carrier protein
MKLRVQFTGQLRTAAGRSEEELDLPESTTLPSLLRVLATHLGDSAAPHLLTSSGHAPCGLLIILNNTAIPASHTATTPLHSGDTITLLPPIAGG